MAGSQLDSNARKSLRDSIMKRMQTMSPEEKSSFFQKMQTLSPAQKDSMFRKMFHFKTNTKPSDSSLQKGNNPDPSKPALVPNPSNPSDSSTNHSPKLGKLKGYLREETLFSYSSMEKANGVPAFLNPGWVIYCSKNHVLKTQKTNQEV